MMRAVCMMVRAWLMLLSGVMQRLRQSMLVLMCASRLACLVLRLAWGDAVAVAAAADAAVAAAAAERTRVCAAYSEYTWYECGVAGAGVADKRARP